MKLFSKFLLLISVLAASVNVVKAEVRIIIDEVTDSAQPIAVVPFGGNSSVNVAEIISADLRNSGKFNPIEISKMPQLPISVNEVNPVDWANLGVNSVIVGQATQDGDTLNIAYQLVDVVGASGQTGTVLLQNSYSLPVSQVRYGAHTMSDEVFEKLTQIRGAFRTKIAYVVQKNNGAHEVRVADYDGFNQFVVARSSQPMMSPAWSADGHKLAYVTFENRKAQLVMHDLSSGFRKVVASFNGHNGAPAFSPDGTRLAFASSKDGKLNIYVMNLGSGQITQLTHSEGNNTEPSWSPDSSSILFTSDRNGSPAVYKMDAFGGGAFLVSGSGRTYSGQISSDGKTLITIASDHIEKTDLVSGQSEILSSTFLDESPSISPNGIMIIYSSTQGLGKVLQLVSADGRFKARLPGSDGQVKFPAWSPYLTKN